MSLAWWLFIRGSLSIRLDVTTPLTLVVRGPGTRRRVHGFTREVDLVEFAIAIERQLREEGWQMAFELDRRSGGDRRRDRRASADRRARPPAATSEP